MAVKPIPDGYSTVTPYLTIDDPAPVIDFLKKAFGAQEIFAMRDDKGNIGHAEVKVGTSIVMLGRAHDQWKSRPGRAHDQWKSRPGNFYVYVDDCDAVYQKALDAGATSISKPENQFYGDRHGGVTDSQGNNWWIATHVEDVTDADMKKRAEEHQKKQTAQK